MRFTAAARRRSRRRHVRPRRALPVGGQRDPRRRAGEELTSLPVAAAVWEPQPDLPTSAECWLMAGGPHHTVLSTQVDPDTLHQLAELLRTELVFIDDTTTRHDFTDRLRWNAAYQRLSLPL